MTSSDLPRSREAHAGLELQRTAGIGAVAAMIGVLFAGSTVVTPLYIMYKQAFGFSQISLTLIYAAYVIGNLCALLVFGGLSDQVGRRPMAFTGMSLALLGTLVFLFARGIASLYCGRILSGLAIGIGAGTGTAWLAELIRKESSARAAVIATAANFTGLGVGALLAGLLAEYGAWPLQLPYMVYFVALAAVMALVGLVPETVARPKRSMKDISITPRVSVPSQIRAQFVAPAVTGFGAMALVGFYAALAPTAGRSTPHHKSCGGRCGLPRACNRGGRRDPRHPAAREPDRDAGGAGADAAERCRARRRPACGIDAAAPGRHRDLRGRLGPWLSRQPAGREPNRAAGPARRNRFELFHLLLRRQFAARDRRRGGLDPPQPGRSQPRLCAHHRDLRAGRARFRDTPPAEMTPPWPQLYPVVRGQKQLEE
jgi:hypothetical protein